MLSLDIGGCSQNPETCTAVQQALDADTFYETIGDMDPHTTEVRAMLGDFVTACANGNCPGRNLELTRAVLRSMREQKET